MNRMEAQEKYNQDALIQIHSSLDLDRVLGGLQGKKFYKDMDKDFLYKIHYITGTVNGILYNPTKGTFKFLMSEGQKDSFGEPVESFTLNFDKYGAYSGISDVVYRGDNTDVYIPVDQVFEAAKKQLRKAVQGFILRAYNTDLLTSKE